MSGTQMAAVFSGLHTEAVSTAVPLLIPRLSEDVRMSLISESLPKLSTQQKLDTLESEEEIPVLIEALVERLGYRERRGLVKRLAEREEEELSSDASMDTNTN